MKKNFLLSKDQAEVINALTDEQAGQLFKGIYNYVTIGESGLKGMMEAIFIPIKKEIDNNEERYKEICEKRKDAVNKRWEKQQKTTKKIQNDTNVYKCIQKNTDTRHISYITNHISLIKDIINYLNNKTNSKYKYNTKATQNRIVARLNEGYKLDDFIAVIDKKYNEWHGTEFEMYLRPETLFGTKFESYLNQPTKTIEQKPDWYGMEIEEEPMTEEEQKRFDELLSRGT
jgi:uncharacterized phage protein (TIGR02220 family)